MPSLTRTKARRAELDWQAARERLARAALDGSKLDPAHGQRILRERARALAQKPASSSSALRPDALEVLHFHWAREQYAIEAQFVHQVIKPSELTRLPGAPPSLRGVTNLRGQILPVFDVREWFEVERAARSDEARWLVLGTDAPELCLWVDAVRELCSIDRRSIHRPERDERHGNDLVSGVTQDAHTLLDGGRLLAHPELFVGEAPSGHQEVGS